MKQDENFALGGSRNHILSTEIHLSSKFFCFDRDENIASYHVWLMMKKGGHIEPKISKIARGIMESGFFVKWQRDHLKTIDKIQQISEKPQTETFTLRHFGFPLLIVYGIGLCSSFLYFLMEKITFNKVNRPNSHRIWKSINKSLEGRRRYFKNLPEKIQQQR